ncbi:hypothetical protein SDRG_14554 [Saprolegnia diclina VS20]|uniref:Uncharacterized protein n=1 Tax=Saprolegnia diclina (strain VS20) TaxID=1156394 RepID=T0PQ88_SAPDV|nr:hypothetical protein SDRG_14554 [Saprolegnia diclina VS20]EQC27644.1 hypothetical protein SDRG_14554 [Saprolegnia diclina VS20]|eukprot:XP_008618912.1 hypothetical protein SDRG_14554 [Saprolegnia diclina VS20]
MLHMNSTIDPVVKDTASLKRRWFDDDNDACDESPAIALRHDLDAITVDVCAMQAQVDQAVLDVQRLMAMITELDGLRKRRRMC